jgi:glucan phosphorylase
VYALAYDTAVPGYNTFTTNAIRQWSAIYNQDELLQPLAVLKSTNLKLAKQIINNHVYSKRLSKN